MAPALIVLSFALFYTSLTVKGQPQHSSTRSLCSAQVGNFVEECGLQEQYNLIRGYVNTRNNTLALNGWNPVCCDQLRFITDNACIDECYNEDIIKNETILASFAVYSSVCVTSQTLPTCLTQQADTTNQDVCENLSQRLVQTCGQQGRDATQNLNNQVACCWSNDCCDLSQQFLVQNCRAQCSGKSSSLRGLAEGISRQWLSACSLPKDLLTCGVLQILSITEVDFSDESAVLQEVENQTLYSQDTKIATIPDKQQQVVDSGCSSQASKEEYIESMQLGTYNRTLSTFCVVNAVSDLQDMTQDVTDTCCTLTQTIISSSCQYAECYDDQVEIFSQETNNLVRLWETICTIDKQSCDFIQALQILTAPTPSPQPLPSPSPQPLPSPSPYPKLNNFQEIVRPVNTVNPTIQQVSTYYTPQDTSTPNTVPAIQFPPQQQNSQQKYPVPQAYQSAPLQSGTPQINPYPLPQAPATPFGFPQRGLGGQSQPLPLPLPPKPRPHPGRGHPPGFPSIVDLVESGNAAISSIFDGILYIPELQGFNLVMSLANMRKQSENYRPITILGVESGAFDAFQSGPVSKILTTGSNDWNRTFQMHVVLEKLDTQKVLDEGEAVAQTLEGGSVTLLGYKRSNEIYVAGCCSDANRAKVQIVAEFQDGVLWVIDKMLYPNGVAQQVYG